MTNWNNSRKRLKIFTKEFWKEYKWQDILINLLIYFAVFSSLLLIDLLTKWGLYIGDKPNEILANYKILGIRSLLHRGTTLEIGLTLPGLHTITFLIIISTILFSALAKKKYYRWWIAGLATIAAGSMGNMVDRFIFKGVRDVFFLPFAVPLQLHWYMRWKWNTWRYVFPLSCSWGALLVVVERKTTATLSRRGPYWWCIAPFKRRATTCSVGKWVG